MGLSVIAGLSCYYYLASLLKVIMLLLATDVTAAARGTSVMLVHLVKAIEWYEMPFGTDTRV